MNGRILLYGILLQLVLLICYHVRSERSVNGRFEFKYDFRFRDRSKAFMCLKKSNSCYIHNMTAQERIDVHDPEKILGIEANLLHLVLHSPDAFIKGNKSLYNHDFVYFRGYCYKGNGTLWLQK